jgi:iron complex outermembrane recepter protein
MQRRLVLASTILSGFAGLMMLSGPAFAQSAPAAQPEEPEAPEVIIVTATGRQAQVQDIPVAVTAVTAQTIQNAGITDVRNLQQVAPSYRVATGQSNSAGTSIAIRGIGTGADNPGFEAAVAVFIDGVYRNRSGVALSELPQIERVEVLRGPQGTLFGRNTSAGAVSVTTAAPKFEQAYYGKMEFGDFGSTVATLGFNVPLSDTFAVRVEGNYTTRDGLIDDVNSLGTVNNRNRYFVRAQGLWDIGESTTLRLIADTSSTDEVCCTALHRELGSTAAAVNGVAAIGGRVGIPSIDLEARRGAYSPNRSYGEQVEEYGASAELNHEMDFAKFTSITAFRDWSTTRNQDIDFSGIDRAYREGFELGFETFTQEFRLNGQAGPVDWLVGAFYANEQTDYLDTVRFGLDGARYVDALARGATATGIPWSTANGPANPCTGSTAFAINPGSSVYGSLGTGGGQIFAQALCPQLFAGFFLTPGSPLQGNFLGSQATALSISNAYGNALIASAPQPGQGVQADRTSVETRSLALFSHNQIAFSDDLTLTVGIRYNTETKDVTANLNANGSTCGVLQNTTQLAPGISFNSLSTGLSTSTLGAFLLLACNPVVNTVANGSYTDDREEKEWSGTLSLQYDLSDDLMVYGTYSRGYKAGGFNLDRSAFRILPTTTARPTSLQDWQFEPEFVDNMELGWKWSGLPLRTTINGAIFHQAITDYQINAFNGFNFVNFNADSVISKGVEIDLAMRPFPGFTVQGGVLYNDAYYDGDAQVTPRPQDRITSGTPIAGASEWTFTGSLTYRGQIPDTDLGWLVYVDGRSQSEYRTQTLGRAPSGSTDQEAFSVFNARVGIGAVDQSWAVEAFVRNLTDQFYIVGAFGVPEQDGTYAVYPGEPRMMGVTLRASF